MNGSEGEGARTRAAVQAAMMEEMAEDSQRWCEGWGRLASVWKRMMMYGV